VSFLVEFAGLLILFIHFFAVLNFTSNFTTIHHVDPLHIQPPTHHHQTDTMSAIASKMPPSRALDTAKQSSEAATSAMSKAAENPKRLTSDFLSTPFINGGLAGMTATTVIQPVDMVKVRLQLAGEGVKTGPKPTPITIFRDIIAQGKAADLYTGLSAGLLRQAVYTTARLGFFDTFMKSLSASAAAKNQTIGFKERAGAGLAAGGLAAMVGNPADLALIRMQSDGLKPKSQRANYTSVIDALSRIAKAEGVSRLWAGCYPTVVRAMAFFSEAKQQHKTTNLSPTTQTLTASAVAGFFASFLSLPFDFMKTRLQKQTRAPDGSMPYKGMFDCARKVVKEEGLLRFYRGFGTYYVRIAPHA
jgi:solute carrier family 25 oxoglutarate transporter 11